MATVYRSKADAWLVMVLATAMAISLYATFAVLSAGSSLAWLIAAPIAGVGIGLPLWLLFSTHYTLEPRQLIVKSGPFKWRIALADITNITPTSNPLSSPALSLDRLRIDYSQGRSLMVSPRYKEQFVLAVEAARVAA
jgi:Bacterial PH domain